MSLASATGQVDTGLWFPAGVNARKKEVLQFPTDFVVVALVPALAPKLVGALERAEGEAPPPAAAPLLRNSNTSVHVAPSPASDIKDVTVESVHRAPLTVDEGAGAKSRTARRGPSLGSLRNRTQQVSGYITVPDPTHDSVRVTLQPQLHLCLL